MKILKEFFITIVVAIGTTISLICGYLIGILIVVGVCVLIHKLLVKLFPNKFKKQEDDFIEIDYRIANMLLENDKMHELIDNGDVIVEHVMYDDDEEIDTVYYYNREKYKK